MRPPRPAAVVDTLGPSEFRVRLGGKELSGGSIQHVIERIAIGESQQFARLAANDAIDEHGYIRRVVIMRIVRSELEVPLQLSGVGVQSDQRT